MTVTEQSGRETFLVDDMNADFINGDTTRPPDALIGVVAVVVVLFIIPMLGLNAVTVDAWLQEDGSGGSSLVLITLVTVAIDVILVGAGAWFTRRFRLRRQGRLVRGEITRAEAQVRPGPRGNEFVLTVYYSLESPRTGQTLRGVIANTRDDLAESPLPEAGTPVDVLYLNDRNFRVM